MVESLEAILLSIVLFPWVFVAGILVAAAVHGEQDARHSRR